MEVVKPREPKGSPFSKKRPLIIGGVIALIVLAVILGVVLTDENKNSNSSATKNATTPGNTSLVVKELGIKIHLSKQLYGMTYAPAKRTSINVPPIANLYLPQYTNMVGSCLGSKGSNTYPFAALAKLTSKSTDSGPKTLKQFDSFRIVTFSSGVPGGIKCQDQTTMEALNQLNAQLNNSLSQAVGTAEKTN